MNVLLQKFGYKSGMSKSMETGLTKEEDNEACTFRENQRERKVIYYDLCLIIHGNQ
jgi:hypothetical protein